MTELVRVTYFPNITGVTEEIIIDDEKGKVFQSFQGDRIKNKIWYEYNGGESPESHFPGTEWAKYCEQILRNIGSQRVEVKKSDLHGVCISLGTDKAPCIVPVESKFFNAGRLGE